MSAVNPELDNFLGVLTKRLQTVPDDDAGALAGTLQDGDAVDLALHTADLDDGLDWLVGTVRTTAQHSPSAAFALATRYAVQHGSQAAGGAEIDRPTSGVVNPAAARPWTVTTPTLLGPAEVILLDRSTGAAAQVSWAGLDVEE